MRPLKSNPAPPGRCPMLTFCGEFCCEAVTVPTRLAVVELAVEVDVHRAGRRVVHAGDVVPGVRLHRRRPVAEHVAAGAAGQLEADDPGPGVDRGVELEAVRPPRLETIAASSSGNAAELIQALIVMLAGEPQAARVAEVDVVVDRRRGATALPYLPLPHVGAVGQACRSGRGPTHRPPSCPLPSSNA